MSKYISNYKFYLCKVLFKTGLLKYLNFTVTKKDGHKSYSIPVINCAGFTNLSPDYEPWFAAFMDRILKSDHPVIVDVGVNIGQTILKIASIKNNLTYIGFEPNPTSYAYTRKLIQANNLKNYKLYPLGLAEKFEMLPLYGDNDYAAGASIISNFRKNVSKYNNVQYVAVAEGDSIMCKEDIDTIDFLKVDVEGAELEVMKGFTTTVEKFRPTVMLEILPVYSLEDENGKRRKTRQDELLQLMKNYNYTAFLIHEKTATIQPITNIPIHSDMGKTNYFFIPMEKTSQYLSMLN